MSHRVSRLPMAIATPLLYGCCMLAAERGADAATVADVSSAMHAYYTAIADTESFQVKWRHDVQNVTPASGTFAWPWIETTFARKSGKYYISVENPQNFTLPCIPNERFRTEIAWNGAVGIQIESHSVPDEEKAKQRGAKVIVSGEPPYFIFWRCFYFHNLGIPFDESFNSRLTERYQYPEGEYWLPTAVARHIDEYRCQEAPEVVNGMSCVVLERQGIDRLWVCPEKSHALVKREFTWGLGKGLRERITNSDFVKFTDGVWIPRKSEREQYCAPWDGPESQGKVCDRHTIRLVEFSVGDVSDDRFETLAVPKRAMGYDERTASYFTVFPTDHKNIDSALEDILSRVPPVRHASWITWLAVGVIFTLIPGSAGFILMRRRKGTWATKHE